MSTSLFKTIELINTSEHSQEYKTMLIQYCQDLSSKNLPIIFDVFHLAQLIGAQPYRIINLVRDRDYLYNTYKIRKKSGGYRWIMSPIDELKDVQDWIKKNILEKIEVHESVNGFLKERSIVSNAREHIGKELILNIDLYRFFDTISEKRVYGLFKALGYTEKLAFDLSRLLCVNPPKKYWREIKKENRLNKKFQKLKLPILPQGAPTSPIISNILAKNLDTSIFEYCNKSNLSYTRYADDMTISGNRRDIPNLKTIKTIIRKNGFTINIKKIKYISKNKKQTVTGITVNNGLFVDKKILKQVKQELYYCIKFGYRNHLEFKSEGTTIKANYKDWLYGKICFIYSVEKEIGKELFIKYNQIDWSI